jgi:branched-chain amino acid aminotransferase
VRRAKSGRERRAATPDRFPKEASVIHRWVYHNHKLLPIDEVRLSPGQAGLLNGWGLFTTLRITSGEPFAFERHWKRLEKDAARTHCPLPGSAERVREELRELARANQVQEGTARIYAIHNRSNFWQSEEPLPEADLILYTAGLPDYREPARLDLREHGRHAASALAGVKVTSWLNNLWHLWEAQQRGFDEVVLLNERGEVAECTAANIFAVHGSEVRTPALASGCLEGVTRAIVLEIAAAAGVPEREITLFPEDLFSAEEVFISSTSRNLLPVAEIAGHKIAAAAGPITRKLEKAFAAYVARYVAERRAPAARTGG